MRVKGYQTKRRNRVFAKNTKNLKLEKAKSEKGKQIENNEGVQMQVSVVLNK